MITGGQAFPYSGGIPATSMSLRDFFAAVALLRGSPLEMLSGPEEMRTTRAREAYLQADAMLAERFKESPQETQ